MASGVQSHADGYIKWLRSHVGNQLIYLVYTVAFVFDGEGRLLVQERYDFDWLSVPGGALELHETLLDCVKRETIEETGIACEVERFIGVYSHPRYNLLYPNGDRVQPWSAGFVCRASSSQIEIDGKETLKAAFHPVADVRRCLPPMYQDMLATLERQPPRAHVDPVYTEAEVRPYYPVLRQHVGSAMIMLPGATGVVFNADGQVLAVHHKSRQVWDLPAGLADLGESSTATIVREIREETGLIVEPVRTLGVYSDPLLNRAALPSGDSWRWVDLIVECRVVGGEARPDGDEIDGIQFMPLQAMAAQPNLLPARRQLLADLLSGEAGPFVR